MAGKLLLTGCRQCARYSQSLGRCMDGKISPKTYKGAKEAVSVCGFNYICKHTVNGDKFRKKMIDETVENLRRKGEDNAQSAVQSTVQHCGL